MKKTQNNQLHKDNRGSVMILVLVCMFMVSLIGAMIVGRVVWGIVSIAIYGVMGNPFSAQMFMAGAILNAVPGIVLQIVLIPIIIMALKRAKVME